MVVFTVLSWLVMGFVFLRLGVVLANWWFRHSLIAPEGSSKALVSILIPARNEAQNLPLLLKSLEGTQGLVHEIIVYNDQSEDDTVKVVLKQAGRDARIRLLQGKSLPPGWLGKSHACHCLSLEASGDYLLFLDADVLIRRRAIELALAQMKKRQLALFSFFPVQIMKTLGEWLVVPQVNIILVSLLPLYFTYKLPWPVFSAANGQFMLFDGLTYQKYQFHQRVKNIAVEDIAISREMKKLKLTVLTGLAPDGLQCRMYKGFNEARNGIARSVIFFFGGSLLAGWIYAAFTTFGWLSVGLTLSATWFLIYLFLLVLMRVGIALLSRQSVVKNILLMPLQQMTFVWVIIKASLQYLRGNITWKGRSLKVR
jgi:chlorobactene glucosyltransferase